MRDTWGRLQGTGVILFYDFSIIKKIWNIALLSWGYCLPPIALLTCHNTDFSNTKKTTFANDLLKVVIDFLSELSNKQSRTCATSADQRPNSSSSRYFKVTPRDIVMHEYNVPVGSGTVRTTSHSTDSEGDKKIASRTPIAPNISRPKSCARTCTTIMVVTKMGFVKDYRRGEGGRWWRGHFER